MMRADEIIKAIKDAPQAATALLVCRRCGKEFNRGYVESLGKFSVVSTSQCKDFGGCDLIPMEQNPNP